MSNSCKHTHKACRNCITTNHEVFLPVRPIKTPNVIHGPYNYNKVRLSLLKLNQEKDIVHIVNYPKEKMSQVLRNKGGFRVYMLS